MRAGGAEFRRLLDRFLKRPATIVLEFWSRLRGTEAATLSWACLNAQSKPPPTAAAMTALMTALAKRRCDVAPSAPELKIETPQFRKPANTACNHCAAPAAASMNAPAGVQQFLCVAAVSELTDGLAPRPQRVLIMRKAPERTAARLSKRGLWRGAGDQPAADGSDPRRLADYIASLLAKNIPSSVGGITLNLLNDHVDPTIGLSALPPELVQL